jgi:hypothetical protein
MRKLEGRWGCFAEVNRDFVHENNCLSICRILLFKAARLV